MYRFMVDGRSEVNGLSLLVNACSASVTGHNFNARSAPCVYVLRRKQFRVLCMITVFRCEVDENSALLGQDAASCCNFLPTFRDNLSVPSSGFKNLEILVLDSLSVKLGPIGCSKTSVRYYHYSLSNNQEKHKCYFYVLYNKCRAVQFGREA
jgi:hypothetical protein